MKFIGNQAVCGSYACLNAIQNPAIDLELFEISTSAPFGIRHCENPCFDRMLTTYRNPNEGLDAALMLWGLEVDTIQTDGAEEIITILRERLTKDNSAVLGPVSMDKLAYQIEPSLLFRMDHYLALRYCSNSDVWCTDSEGFPDFRVPYQTLSRWISVALLPEAQGCVTLRIIRGGLRNDKRSIVESSFQNAATNLTEAEAAGQGSYAVQNCFRTLLQERIYRWRLSLLYDLEYLHQRKRLLLSLIDFGIQEGILTEYSAEAVRSITLRQMNALSLVYETLMFHNRLHDSAFLSIGDDEKALSEKMRLLVSSEIK